MNLQGLDIANLRAMKNELIEEKQLQEASGNTEKAHDAAVQASKINEEINARMQENGVMLRS